MADPENTRSPLPIELSSIVTSLESVTRELIKKLSRDEAAAVIAELCERLRITLDDKRGPDRPFSR